MAFFKRTKNGPENGPKNGPKKVVRTEAGASKREAQTSSASPRESSPQRVGVVSGILTTSADMEGPGEFSSILHKHFGPDLESKRAPDSKPPPTPERNDRLRAVESVEDVVSESLILEVDPMAHIGHATTITGNIVAEEDLEIEGTVEGSVRLPNHQVTIGADGVVKASVEAHTVLVIGKITGDVTATEVVEVKPGGIIGGDVKAKRVIMHDGAIVVGALDMSAALSSSAATSEVESSSHEPSPPDRPKLIRVDLPSGSSSDSADARTP